MSSKHDGPGMGTASVQDIVREPGGFIQFSTDDARFGIKVLLQKADGILEIPFGDLVRLRLLHIAVHAPEQLAEGIGRVRRIVAQRKAGIAGAVRGHRARRVEHVHALRPQRGGQARKLPARRQLRTLGQDVGCCLRLAQVAAAVAALQQLHIRGIAHEGILHLDKPLLVLTYSIAELALAQPGISASTASMLSKASRAVIFLFIAILLNFILSRRKGDRKLLFQIYHSI